MTDIALSRASGGCAAAVGALLAFAIAAPASAQVTFERLLNVDAEPQNWLTSHRSYKAHRHSPLDQINSANVGSLRFAYAWALGGLQGGGRAGHGALQATPLVDNGMLYATDAWGSVYKLDVRAGNRAQFVWKMDPGTDPSLPEGRLRNRGAALFGDKVYSDNVDGNVFATNAETGEIVWEVKLITGAGEYLSVAPLALKDIVIIGSSGADNGVRGWIDALDAETGEKRWRTWLIPGPGEPGHETWADDWGAWKTGGGSAWVTGSYDAEQDLTIWGIGNPAPDFDSAYRPGDNLYTNSVLGMNPDTGAIQWYFQYTPNDAWDFDEVGTHILIDVEIDGQPRKAMGHSARNGFFYTLDRTNGQFINGVQYVKELNWTTGLDSKTGMPLEYDPNLKVQTYVPGTQANDLIPEGQVCPNIGGGNNYFPSVYSPDTLTFYAIGNEGCSNLKKTTFEPGTYKINDPAGFGNISWKERYTSTISAIDMRTGQITTQAEFPYANYGGLLSTGGNLIVTGYLDGSLVAYDSGSLDELWRVNLGSPINAPPMTFAVDGKQYLAQLVGVSTIAIGRNRNSPEIANLNPTSYLFVFAL